MVPDAWRSLLPIVPLNDLSAAFWGASVSDACWMARGLRSAAALDREVGHVHRAARRDPVVLLLVDVRHPGAHRRVGRDGAGELVDPLELDACGARRRGRPCRPRARRRRDRRAGS